MMTMHQPHPPYLRADVDARRIDLEDDIELGAAEAARIECEVLPVEHG
jgi:hypothetical protein